MDIYLEQLKNKCENLMALMNTNIYIHSNGTHETIEFSKITIPPFLTTYVKKFVEEKFIEKEHIDEEDIRNNRVYLYEDPFRMEYLTCPFENNQHGKYSVTLGPLLSKQLTREEVRYIGYNRGLSSDNCFIMENFYGVVPFFENIQIIRLASLLLDYLPKDSHLPQIIREGEHKEKRMKAYDVEDKFKDYDFAEQNYSSENTFLKAIEAGDIDFMYNEMLSGDYNIALPKRFPNDPLRERKNMLITLNSISVRAALRGGLDTNIAHALSHTFAIRIETQISIEALTKLSVEMLKTYIESVHKYSVKQFTPIVANAMRYIRTHLVQPITLVDIANELHVTREHLSRTFKAEMGITLFEYIHKMKIEESCDLLAFKNKTIAEIAYVFGFASPAHYTKIFKKIMAMTPKEYREKS